MRFEIRAGHLAVATVNGIIIARAGAVLSMSCQATLYSSLYVPLNPSVVNLNLKHATKPEVLRQCASGIEAVMLAAWHVKGT